MFEDALKDGLKAIFDFKKTTFDEPGESMEQNCLFVNVSTPRIHITDGRQRGKVEGLAYVFSTSDKLPFDYFAKRIAAAEESLTRPFFFHEIGSSVQMGNNIVRRSVRFVFFYDAQYDPDLGTITSVDFQEGEEP